MKKFKKILAIVLIMALTSAVTMGATLALLTDTTEVKHNVFHVGDVDISVEEKVDVEGAGSVEEVLNPEGENVGAEYTGVMPGDKLIKEVTVSNDGEQPAYVAVTVTINNADKINAVLDEIYEKDPYNYDAAQMQQLYDTVFEGFGLRYDKVDAQGNAIGMRLSNQLPLDENLLRVDATKTTAQDDYFFYDYNNWFRTDAEKNNTGYGMFPASEGYYAADMNPYELRYTYYLYLDGGESYKLFDGLNVPLEFNREQLSMFEGLNISVEASAIQADNLPGPQEAFALLATEMAKANP